MTRKPNKHRGSTLDDFFRKEGAEPVQLCSHRYHVQCCPMLVCPERPTTERILVRIPKLCHPCERWFRFKHLGVCDRPSEESQWTVEGMAREINGLAFQDKWTRSDWLNVFQAYAHVSSAFVGYQWLAGQLMLAALGEEPGWLVNGDYAPISFR